MRAIKNLADAQVVLKSVLDWQTNVQTKDQDLNQRRYRNAAPGVLPDDYVTVKQLPTVQVTPPTPDQHYMIVFSSIGAIIAGQLCAAYIVGQNRIGKPTEVIVNAITAPTTNATFNVQVNNVNLLLTDVTLPAGQTGPITVTNFVTPVPLFAYQTVVIPVVTAAGGAAFVTVQIQVLRTLNTQGVQSGS